MSSMDEYYWEDEYYDAPDSYSRNANAPIGVHIPNKNEGKLLRKLMNQTGLSEEKLRKHKKYRKMLSDAQVLGTKATKTREEKQIAYVMREVTRELKLAKEHPDCIALFDKKWKERYSIGFSHHPFL